MAEDLVSLRDRRIAARVRLWAAVTADVGRAVVIVAWAVYLIIALIAGQPIVSL